MYSNKGVCRNESVVSCLLCPVSCASMIRMSYVNPATYWDYERVADLPGTAAWSNFTHVLSDYIDGQKQQEEDLLYEFCVHIEFLSSSRWYVCWLQVVGICEPMNGRCIIILGIWNANADLNSKLEHWSTDKKDKIPKYTVIVLLLLLLAVIKPNTPRLPLPF